MVTILRNRGSLGHGGAGDGFWAKITGNSGGAYSWIEVVPQIGGTFATLTGGRNGTTTVKQAYEINGNASVATNSFVFLRRLSNAEYGFSLEPAGDIIFGSYDNYLIGAPGNSVLFSKRDEDDVDLTTNETVESGRYVRFIYPSTRGVIGKNSNNVWLPLNPDGHYLYGKPTAAIAPGATGTINVYALVAGEWTIVTGAARTAFNILNKTVETWDVVRCDFLDDDPQWLIVDTVYDADSRSQEIAFAVLDSGQNAYWDGVNDAVTGTASVWEPGVSNWTDSTKNITVEGKFDRNTGTDDGFGIFLSGTLVQVIKRRAKWYPISPAYELKGYFYDTSVTKGSLARFHVGYGWASSKWEDAGIDLGSTTAAVRNVGCATVTGNSVFGASGAQRCVGGWDKKKKEFQVAPLEA